MLILSFCEVHRLTMQAFFYYTCLEIFVLLVNKGNGELGLNTKMEEIVANNQG